jgi:hypothetical protein
LTRPFHIRTVPERSSTPAGGDPTDGCPRQPAVGRGRSYPQTGRSHSRQSSTKHRPGARRAGRRLRLGRRHRAPAPHPGGRTPRRSSRRPTTGGPASRWTDHGSPAGNRSPRNRCRMILTRLIGLPLPKSRPTPGPADRHPRSPVQVQRDPAVLIEVDSGERQLPQCPTALSPPAAAHERGAARADGFRDATDSGQ